MNERVDVEVETTQTAIAVCTSDVAIDTALGWMAMENALREICRAAGGGVIDGWSAQELADHARRAVEIALKQSKPEPSPDRPSPDPEVRCGCGAPMVKRKRKNDGHAFWGCIQYPECKRTKQCNDNRDRPKAKPSPDGSTEPKVEPGYLEKVTTHMGEIAMSDEDTHWRGFNDGWGEDW